MCPEITYLAIFSPKSFEVPLGFSTPWNRKYNTISNMTETESIATSIFVELQHGITSYWTTFGLSVRHKQADNATLCPETQIHSDNHCLHVIRSTLNPKLANYCVNVKLISISAYHLTTQWLSSTTTWVILETSTEDLIDELSTSGDMNMWVLVSKALASPALVVTYSDSNPHSLNHWSWRMHSSRSGITTKTFPWVSTKY